MASSKWIDVTADDPMETVVRRALRGRLEAVLEYLERAALHADDDPEYVHQLRVWARRSLAAIDLFKSFLPKRQRSWMRRKLNRLRRAAGEARDDDVLAMQFAAEHPSQAAPLIGVLQQHRRRAQRPIEKAFRKLRRRGKLARHTKKLLRFARDAQSNTSLRDWAWQPMSDRVQAFLSAARAIDPHDDNALHALRILSKRLRYAMELTAAAFPPAFRDELYPQVEAIQEQLGQVNDHALAVRKLRSWQKKPGLELWSDALSQWIAREEASLIATRAAFAKRWTHEALTLLADRFSQALSLNTSPPIAQD